MKQWYLFYSQEDTKLQQFVGELGIEKFHQAGGETKNLKLHQFGGEFPAPFALVPWRHHVEIISKCKSVDETLFYIGKTIEQGMSRAAREFAAQT